MIPIVHPRKTSTLVGVVSMTFIECFNTLCVHQNLVPLFNIKCCQLLLLFREMEIINGIKFHAIISFDFSSHFLFACFVIISLRAETREEAEQSYKEISSALRKRPLDIIFFLLLRLSSAIFTVSRNSFEQWLKGFLYFQGTWRILFSCFSQTATTSRIVF